MSAFFIIIIQTNAEMKRKDKTVYGKLYGVSTGPGDPELMTLKAVKIIEKCGVIAAPKTGAEKTLALDIASQAVDISGKTVITLDMPMTHDREELARSRYDAACRIAEYLKKGEDTAMLNIGDVSIYSTFSYVAEEVRKMGFETEAAAGVPSFCAAAAELGISLTEGHQPLTVIPAQNKNAAGLLSSDGTKVIMKSGKKLSEIKELLKESAGTVCAVENCGLPGQKIYRSLDEINECGYFTLIIAKA